MQLQLFTVMGASHFGLVFSPGQIIALPLSTVTSFLLTISPLVTVLEAVTSRSLQYAQVLPVFSIS